ncbi:MAG: polymer-forming cytoskeletal protein [Candidatus Humimicrobiaceae bacterium]|jgi:cytoskeletal protein CcmA (bactofilin family)|nr:polymer-forming cytoskeletal protein [Candidatus Humimicrobiaceae bacterium]
MSFKKNAEMPGIKNLTIIAEGVEINGNINCPGSLRIDGEVKGEIIAGKDITIGKSGIVEANVKTTNAVIAGTYKGDMVASGEVEITSTGKFIGNLTQKDALLTIAKGGLFKGGSAINSSSEVFKTKDERKNKIKGFENPEFKNPKEAGDTF